MITTTRRIPPVIEQQWIIEEVTYLLEGGYRPHQKQWILDGMAYAVQEYSLSDWKLWADFTLECLMNKFYEYGREY